MTSTRKYQLAGLTVTAFIAFIALLCLVCKNGPPVAALRGAAAIEHLKQQGTYDSLAAIAAARYQVAWEVNPRLRALGAAYHAQNPV
jgi:hypothetical protein